MIEWKRNQGQFSSGKIGYRNGIIIFSYHWDSIRGSDKNWQLRCQLPGIKPILGNYATEADAETKAGEVFGFWLGKMGLITA
jgi:hypothetical protein